MIRPILLAVSILSFALLVVSGQTAGCWCSALPATTAPGCWPEPRWHHPGGVIMVPSRRSSHRASSRSAQIWSHRRNYRPDRTKHLQQAPSRQDGQQPDLQSEPSPSTPAVDRDLAGQGVAMVGEQTGRPPLMIRCCENNRRSDGGRRPQPIACALAGGAGRVVGPGRGPVWAGGAQAAGQSVHARAAGGAATQELLDDR